MCHSTWTCVFFRSGLNIPSAVTLTRLFNWLVAFIMMSCWDWRWPHGTEKLLGEYSILMLSGMGRAQNNSTAHWLLFFSQRTDDGVDAQTSSSHCLKILFSFFFLVSGVKNKIDHFKCMWYHDAGCHGHLWSAPRLRTRAMHVSD